jgi:hypothetical protein
MKFSFTHSFYVPLALNIASSIANLCAYTLRKKENYCKIIIELGATEAER